jgi:hypothetical protein
MRIFSIFLCLLSACVLDLKPNTVPAPPTPDFGTCPSGECGLNSPVVNAFPYGALHPDGLANAHGVWLAPRSLARDRSACDAPHQDDLYLDVVALDDPANHGHELIGKAASDGSVRCRGAELIGATFAVWVRHVDPRTKQVTTERQSLRISQMATTLIGTSHEASESPRRTVYLITPADAPMASLCTSPPPRSERKPKSLPILLNTMNQTLPVISSEELAAYAIIIPGAVFDKNAEVIADSVGATSSSQPAANSSRRWFNFACATDGLAQTELSQLVTEPIVDQASARRRLAALHMFTAKYCNGLSATARGTPIGWQSARLASRHPRQHSTGNADIIEAKWTDTGATCLSHSRLWMYNKTISLPITLDTMAAALSSPVSEHGFLQMLCPKLPACDAAADDALTSFTVDHIQSP